MHKKLLTEEIVAQLIQGNYIPNAPKDGIPIEATDCFSLCPDLRVDDCMRCNESNVCLKAKEIKEQKDSQLKGRFVR